MIKKYKIFEILFSDLSYYDIIDLMNDSIINQKKISIGYCTAHILNLEYSNTTYRNFLNSFNYLQIDGIGTYLASKIIYGKKCFHKKITGSDLYPLMIKTGIKKGWRFYFIGGKNILLNVISYHLPHLNIAGICNGFDFNTDEIINEINSKKVNILIVGLGAPKQEEWIINNIDRLSANVVIAVGGGIKVFTGTKKRGPKFIQMIGLEWLVRLCYEPVRLWRRYIFGIPLFVFRVIRMKVMGKSKGSG